MVYTHELAREGEGAYRFQDFFRDERAMAGLFERFVCNFYREELGKRDPEARIVGSEWIESTCPELVEGGEEEKGCRLPGQRLN